jgi:hypothetical protein
VSTALDAAASAPALDRPVAPASRAAMLALARVEGVRLLLHPVTLAALLVLLGFWTRSWLTGADRFPVLHDEDRGVQFAVLVLVGGAALIGSNLAVLRARRHRVTELYGVLVLPPAWRLGAHLLAVAPLALLTAALVGVRTALLMLPAGAVGRPDAFELAASPLAVLFMGAVGVLLGRFIGTMVVAPVAVLTVTVGSFAAAMPGVPSWAPWLLPIGFVDSPMPMPSDLLARPAATHALYVVGVLGLVAVAAVGGATRRSVVIAAVALAVALTGGVAQSRPVDKAVRDGRVTATERPAQMQTCVRRQQVAYCAFHEFTPWVGDWDRVVRGVLARVPRTIADRPLAVRQRVVAYGDPDDGSPAFGSPVNGSTWGPEDEQAFADAQEQADAAAGTPNAVSVGTKWGGGVEEVTFGAFVAYRVLAGNDTSAEAPCGSRSVLIAWLAALVSPHAAAGLRELDDNSWGAVMFQGPHLMETISVDDRDMAIAKALLRKPAGEVAQKIIGTWDEVGAADAPTERIAQLFGIPVAPPVEGRMATPCDR